jgi:gliding motility-associated-like protein
VTVVGTAENGIAQSTYTLKIVRGRSGDATLSTIMLNGTAISGFAPNDTLYTQTVDNSNTSTGISALTTIDGASLFINDTSYAPGTLHKINLKIGKNLVYLKVISQDTKSTKTYTLEIDRLLEAQAFTFPAIPTKTAVDPDFPAGAKVNTGLPIVYKSSDETVATVSSSGMVHLLDTGSTTITASINASPLDSAYYNQYKPISQVLKVTRAQQTITGFTFPKLYKDSIYVLDNVKTNAVGLQVQFTSSDSSLVKVDKIYPDTNDKTRYFSVLKALEFGQVTITASQDGNKLYLPATSLALTINVEDPGGPDLKVVQAVTPNGDGMNDVLKIYGIDNYTNNSVTIYNPYGVRVYSEKNYDNITRVFDGHSNITGKFLPAGTYFYFIKYLKGSESKHKTGYIVLKY